MDTPDIGLRGKLFVVLQHLIPQRLLTRLVYRLTRIRQPAIRNATIRWFSWQFGVDTTEAASPVPEGYAHFNDFFTRRLKPGLRPQPDDPTAVASPCDGVISQAGVIEDGRLLQVKGIDYDIADLLAGDPAAETLNGGSFLTVYLAPYDYHRVHMPLAGRLLRTRHVPGRLFSVNATTAASLPGLFTRNERLVTLFASAAGSAFAVVMVGALNVGTIGVAWGQEFRAGGRRPIVGDYTTDDSSPRLERGDELGWFNMGSTVILLLPRTLGRISTGLSPGTKLRTGQPVGSLSLP